MACLWYLLFWIKIQDSWTTHTQAHIFLTKKSNNNQYKKASVSTKVLTRLNTRAYKFMIFHLNVHILSRSQQQKKRSHNLHHTRKNQLRPGRTRIFQEFMKNISIRIHLLYLRKCINQEGRPLQVKNLISTLRRW